MKISGTGKALRQFVYSRDLAKFFLWTLREYNEIDTIIFSGFYTFFLKRINNIITYLKIYKVDENDEISIRELVDTIVDCMQFKGDVIVRNNFIKLTMIFN